MRARPTPPICFRDEDHVVTLHGDKRRLPYWWLKNKKTNPKVREFVRAETEYAETLLPRDDVNVLYRELIGRKKLDDISVPFAHNGYYHYIRSSSELDFELHCRRPVNSDPTFVQRCIDALRADPAAQFEAADDEEVVLDINELCKSMKVGSLDLGDFSYSPDQQLLAFTVSVGEEEDEEYIVFVKDLVSGATLRKISRVAKLGVPGGDLVWAMDSLLYFNVINGKGRSHALVRCDLSPFASRLADCRAQAAGTPVVREVPSVASALSSAEAEKVTLAAYDDHTGLKLAFREKDDEFEISMLHRSDDDAWLLVASTSPDTTEVRVAPAQSTDEVTWQVFLPRERGVSYSVHPHPRCWFVVHDRPPSVNRRIDAYLVDELPANPDHFISVLDCSTTVSIEAMELFADFAVIEVRRNGFPATLVMGFDWAMRRIGSGNTSPLLVDELVDVEAIIERTALSIPLLFDVLPPGSRGERLVGIESIGEGDGFSSAHFRVRVETFTGPGTLLEITRGADAGVGESWSASFVHQSPIFCDPPHDPKNFTSRLLWADAPEGPASGSATVRVPIVVTYRSDHFEPGSVPAVVQVYGSYGDTDINFFSMDTLTLLNRGVAVAFAMVRGGGQFGPGWHYSGRRENRGNSVTDFIACVDTLRNAGICDPQRIAAEGGSAGATVVGGAMVRRPDLFRSLLLQVPFVDNLTTMCDPTLPMVTEEYGEWGNPVAHADAYCAIKGYAPMENVPTHSKAVFPHVLMTSSWNDGRVGIQEPAAFCASLRHVWDASAAEGRVLLHWCDFSSGHGGASARHGSTMEIAREYAFLLATLGVPLH